MAFKFVVLATLLAAANAGLIAAPAATSYSSRSIAHAAPAYTTYAAPSYKVAAPIAQYSYAAPSVATHAAPIHKAIVAEQYAPAEYNFEYSVHDVHTGDIKSQKEVRHGDDVQGSYSLVEADGSKRIVEYTADEYNGFNAIVHREPASHPITVKAVAPVAHYSTAPIAHYTAAPVTHYDAASVAHYTAAPAYPSYSHPTFLHH